MGNVEQAEEQIRGELERIQPVVEELTGLRSRWNGRIELVPDPGFKGVKRFSCVIAMDLSMVGDDVRWRTFIHELLHAVSAGYLPSDYRSLLGWEEGVVEHLQRSIRSSVLSRIGVQVPEQVFWAVEEHHPFNRYIEALETLRGELKLQELDFYRNLLGCPIGRRPTSVFAMRGNLPDDQRKRFTVTFARAHTILRG
jgi:hypothetical protein